MCTQSWIRSSSVESTLKGDVADHLPRISSLGASRRSSLVNQSKKVLMRGLSGDTPSRTTSSAALHPVRHTTHLIHKPVAHTTPSTYTRRAQFSAANTALNRSS